MIKKVIDQTHNFQLKRRIENLAEKNGSKNLQLLEEKLKETKKKLNPTLIVLSPDAETMYLSSKSTTLTAAL